MIPAKNYFSGGLGKLKNIGGSRFFTTPHTVQVLAEYEINSGSQGEFIACSLDGRLWLFDDKLTVLKWNSSSLRTEITKSIEIGDVNFIARGIDWILITNSFFQVLDDAPYIFSEQVSFNDNFSVDKFYSFLPEIDGWQIINNFLVRRSGNEDEASFRSLSIPASLYLTHLEDVIYGKDSSNIGTVSIEDYQLVISPDYSTGANVSGLAFLDKTLYGFRLKQDSSLCPMSDDSLLYNPKAGSWSNVFDGEDTTGNIFFDPFNYKALAVRDDAVNLLPEKKIFTAKGISQWFAPTKNIANVTSDFTIAQLEHDILATHINSGLYREIIHQKNLTLTCRGFSDYKLSIGRNANVLKFNKIPQRHKQLINIELVNVISTSYCIFFLDVLTTYATSRPFENKVFLFEVSSARKYKIKIIRYSEQKIYDSFSDSYETVKGDVFLEDSDSIPKDYYDEDGEYHDAPDYYIEQCDTKIAYINPTTGDLSFFEVSIKPSNKINFLTKTDYISVTTGGGGQYRIYYSYQDIDRDNTELMMDFDSSDFYIYNSTIYIRGFFFDGKWHTRNILFPIADIPDEIKSYIPDININSKNQIRLLLDHFYLGNIKFINGVWYSDYFLDTTSVKSPFNIYFKDNLTGIVYPLDIYPAIEDLLIYDCDFKIIILTFPDWNNLNSSCVIAWHIINFYNKENNLNRLLIFRSEINT